MILSALQNYVLTRLQIEATQASLLTQITTVLNQEMLRIHEELELDLAVATVVITANTSTAALQTDVQKIKWVQNGRIVLPSVDEYEFVGYLAATAAGVATPVSNPPMVFVYRRPGTIAVWPTPTQNVTLTYAYVQRPTLMSGASDLPGSLPAEWHDYLAEVTTWRVALTEGETAVADDAAVIAASLYGRMKAALMIDQGLRDPGRVILKHYG
jgi:hypothetical protein